MTSYLSPQLKYLIFYMFFCILHLLRVYYSQCYQLPVGLIAQLVEHSTGIAEVIGSILVQALTPSRHLINLKQLESEKIKWWTIRAVSVSPRINTVGDKVKN